MSEVWLVVILVGVVTMLFKAAGPVLLGDRELPTRAFDVVTLLAPAVLAALVAVNVFAGDRELVLDARAVGIAVAIGALLLRAPLLVVVFAAALATALARLL